MKILLLNGPNLNLLGLRDRKIYGSDTLERIIESLSELAKAHECHIVAEQSNHEGHLIDWIHEAIAERDTSGIILNGGGLTHSSVSLRDAVEIAGHLGIPTVEVHLSDISERETFRHVSLLTGVCIATVKGQRAESYTLGFIKLIEYIAGQRKQ